jgi:hypothetical protein
MDKEKLRKTRDDAVSLELDIDTDDRVLEMVSRASGLFIITQKKILRQRSPDDLDQDLEHEDAPWEQSVILPLGASDPIVARAVIQTIKLTEIFFAKNSEKFTQLSDISWEVMNSLVSLRFIKERLEKQVTDIKEVVSSDMAIYTEGQSPKPLPAVEYYDIEFRAFINEVKRCLDVISELFPVLSDLKFGMKHKSYDKNFGRGHFHKAQAWAEEIRGKDSLLTQMLDGDQRWIGKWIAMRIAIEHPCKDKYIETLNFSLEANRNVRLPTWSFIHPDFDMARPQNLLEVFDICIENLLKFYEDLQITLLDGHLPPMFKIGIETIPEESRETKMPLRHNITTMVEKTLQS